MLLELEKREFVEDGFSNAFPVCNGALLLPFSTNDVFDACVVGEGDEFLEVRGEFFREEREFQAWEFDVVNDEGVCGHARESFYAIAILVGQTIKFDW